MFKSTNNYFAKFQCPTVSEGRNCTILNCLFSHQKPDLKRPLEDDSRLDSRPVKRSHNEQLSPQAKKPEASKPKVVALPIQRVEEPEEEEDDEDEEGYRLIPMNIDHLELNFEIRHANINQILGYYEDQELSKTEQHALMQEYEIAVLSRTKEEYAANIKRFLSGQEIKVIKDPQFILPKEVKPKPPASLQDRKRFIRIMADTIIKATPNERTPILKAIDEEYKVASTTSAVTYNQSIKKKIHQTAHPEKYERKVETLSNADFLKSLDQLVIAKSKLEKFGYIMELPERVELESQRVCRRCGANFIMDEQLKVVECRFHPGRIKRKDKLTRFYDCCGSEVGSENITCSISKHHIFYWNDAQEMHSAIPFEKITHTSKTAVKAVGIDCEMGYTTLGFELLRATAIDFLTGEDVFDIFVKPIGQVIDLNTRYSGIAEIKEGALSFEESQHFMRQYIDKGTVLIGHGLENDMNAMRMIHERIVDTAVLYPKFRASPTFRFSLKDLSFSYLSRNIQTGEHDSREDSLAAIDIVKYFIQKEKKMAQS